MAKKNLNKRTYFEDIKKVVPGVYYQKDYELSGFRKSSVDALINSHINFCINQASILNISATPNFSDINQVSGIGKWFIKQNNLTDITARNLDLNIFNPLGYAKTDYTSSATFKTFITDTFLPSIHLNSSSLHSTTASAFATDASGTHEKLINLLGWAYLLNTSGTNYSPSSFVAGALTDLYFDGTPFDTAKGVEGLTHFIWEDWASLSSISDALLPPNYFSGTGAYTSGTQSREALKGLVNIAYSNLYADKDDTYVKTAINDYAENGTLLDGEEDAGPLSRLLTSFSYSFFDTNNDVTLLDSLYNIEECPDHLLPYLADLIGWKVYGTSPSGWRRQIRNAISLYKQKGTKAGIYNALTTVLPNTAFESSSITEFYESYVPNLLYYLLKTDTTLFDSFSTWDYTKAAKFTNGEYDPSYMDTNIRYVIDWILYKAVQLFPDLFRVKNFKFDITNPEFVFQYRGRAFPLPPWEEEKFYKDCDVTEELLSFLENELICLGVNEINAKKFRSFVGANTSVGVVDAKFYDNGFFFLTSSLSQPPNRDEIVDNFSVNKYDYFPLWNSKSSHFDVNVSSGPFLGEFFQSDDFLKEDFFRSLAVVDDFSPAKAIPRVRVNLDDTDVVALIEFTCPSVRYWLHDTALSGALAGAHNSGMDIRSMSGALGDRFSSLDNSGRATNDHTLLPTFKRDFVNNTLDKANLIGENYTSAPKTDIFRNNIRRRNFSKTLEKGGLYTRTGLNMPIYFNTSDAGADVEYQPLGFLNLISRYHKVVNPFNLYELSTFPDNRDVWSDCWDINSSRSLSGIAASSMFPIRGTIKLAVSTCHSYVARDRTPEFYNFLHSLIDTKLEYQANYIANANKFLLDTSSYLNASSSIKNILWRDFDLGYDDIYNVILGKREKSRGSIDGMHMFYKDYVTHFASHGVGNGTLETIDDGGLNILSHTYGPLVHNGKFTAEGSGVDIGTSSHLISKTLTRLEPFSVKDLTGIGNITASAATDLFVQDSEVRNPHILSGVEFVDSAAGTSKFTVVNLDTSTSIRGRENYLTDNVVILTEPEGGASRIRFSIKDYGAQTNLLVPEHEYELTLNAAIGNKDSIVLGGGAFGAWIHTDVETDSQGNVGFWNYMPNGTWTYIPASLVVSGNTGTQYVLQNLIHPMSYAEKYILSGESTCFLTASDKDVLLNMGAADFRTTKVSFNTNNQPIKTHLPYYLQFNKVHRGSQNYIFEIFNLGSQIDKYGILDSVSIADLRQVNRVRVKHNFSHNDYSQAKDVMKDNFKFLLPSGGEIAIGTTLVSDAIGNVTTLDGESVTYKESQSLGYGLSKVVLYSQVALKDPAVWATDANGTVINLSSINYSGPFSFAASSISDPSTLTIGGKTKGSNVIKSVDALVPYTKEQVLAILREFNRLKGGLASRDASISQSSFGLDGGSRLDYKVAPMWEQLGGHTTFLSDNNQYTDLRVEN